ncbi:hypothetical protein PMIN06_004894 [Paraphaeosphaeria minitans]
MCHKLFQVLCCGHTKEVCITPCAYALQTALVHPPAPATPTYQQQQRSEMHLLGHHAPPQPSTTQPRTDQPAPLTPIHTPSPSTIATCAPRLTLPNPPPSPLRNTLPPPVLHSYYKLPD